MKLSSNLRYRVVAIGDLYHWIDRLTNKPLTYDVAHVTCEACVRGYRLASDGIHNDDESGGATWGICRKVTMLEARFTSLDEAIAAFVEGNLTVKTNEVLA